MNDLSMVVQVRRTTRFHGYCFDFGYQLVLYERAPPFLGLSLRYQGDFGVVIKTD